jgi:hypothetical protein
MEARVFASNSRKAAARAGRMSLRLARFFGAVGRHFLWGAVFALYAVPSWAATTVTLTYPPNGATVSGSAVPVWAEATTDCDDGIARLILYIDDSPVAHDLDVPYRFSWNVSGYADGSMHQVKVAAQDWCGNFPYSAVHTVTVQNSAPDSLAPAVGMTAPANGAKVGGASVTLSADAEDNLGVAGVQFRIDGANAGAEDISAPFSIPWDSRAVGDGNHTVTAVARDAAGNSSASSGITITVDNTPSVISAVTVADLGSSSATITWTTNEPADSQVEYGLSASYGNFSPLNSTLTTSHSRTITGLSANTVYHFRVRSRDDVGNLAVSGDRTFTTLVSDITPPTVGMTAPAVGAVVRGNNVTVSGTASDSVGVAGVQFKLDGANLGAEDTSAPYSISWDSTGASDGSHVLTAVARDTAGNTTTSAGITVTVDNNGPSVSVTAPAAGAVVRGNNVTVSGTASDDVAVAGVQFKLDGANLGGEDTSAPYSISWDSTGASDGSHVLTAVARDTAGNTTTSAGITVTVDNTQPVISAVTAAQVWFTSATITWTTDEPANSQVEYGPTPSYGSSTPLDINRVINHSQTITGLSVGAEYHYRVRSQDAAGNLAVSGDFTFRTGLQAPGAAPFSNVQTDRISANWTAATNPPGTTYTAEVAASQAFSPILRQINAGASVSAVFDSLDHNTTYWFRVRAVLGSDVSSDTNLGSAMTAVHPAVNPLLSVYASSAAFTWEDTQNTNNRPLRYTAQVSTDNPGFDPIAASSDVTHGPTGVISSTVTSLVPNTTYFYRIAAYNGANQPAYTAANSGNPLATRPVAPDSGRFESVYATSFTVSWLETSGMFSDNAPGTRYRVEISTAANFAVPASATTASLSHSFSNLLADSIFFARVQALGHGGTDSDYLAIGSTATRPLGISNARFTDVGISSMTVQWDTENGPNTQYEVTIDTDADPAQVLGSMVTSATSASFVSLSTNTIYYFSIAVLPANPGWVLPPLTVNGSTLADMPEPGSPSITAVHLSSAAVQWGPNTNPPGTSYRVRYSSTGFVSFGTADAGSPNFVVTGLAFNTTYSFQVAAVSHGGAESAYVSLGSTATQATLPSFAGYVTMSSSVTVRWNHNGNPPDTSYFVENLRDLGAATVDGNEWTDTGLSPNTTYQFRVQAVSRSGARTGFVAFGLARTLAAVPIPILVGADSQNSLQIRFSPAANPELAPNRTQFAIKIVDEDPFAGREGTFIRPLATAGNIHSTTTLGNLSDDAVWGSFEDWNNGVFIATGLASGTSYRFGFYARNGNDGRLDDGAPGIVVGPALSGAGQSGSGVPTILFGDVSAQDADRRPVWMNTTRASFTATGSFHYHYHMNYRSAARNALDKDPGWNGRIEPGKPAGGFALPSPGPLSPPDNTDDALAYFSLPGEGAFELNVLGDDFPSGNHLTPHHAFPFRFSVDLGKPQIASLTGRFGPSDSQEILSGVPTPDQTPTFQWQADDPALDKDRPFSSGPEGYTWTFSTDRSVKPAADVLDPSYTTTAQVDITATQAYGTTVYFNVRAKDAAGNWSDPVEFIYIPLPDDGRPSVDRVDFFEGPRSVGVLVPNSGHGAAVSPAANIRVRFSERMHGLSLSTGSLKLIESRNHRWETVNREIPISVSYQPQGEKGAAIVDPQETLSQGSLYELWITTDARDEAGNPAHRETRKFYTLMDPAEANVVNDEDGARVRFGPGAWGEAPAGCAINGDPLKTPMETPSVLPSLIETANANARRSGGAYAKLLTVREMNLFDAAGSRVSGRFKSPVSLTLSYKDDDNDGVVDGTSPPIRESALSISWLDEELGVWVRVPGSAVDAARNTITADIPHFSVYAIVGAAATDLSEAYAFPVPYKASQSATKRIRFNKLSSLATIRVYTVNGELVKELHEDDGDGKLDWDVTNGHGEPLASDVYIYLIQNGQEKKTGKLIVIR